ncbi:MAG: DegQ family serine endoprotease [Nitrospirae bacterium]|nr:DegQ family serine endoprotease [Nitrospirota bacterium]
MNSKKILIILLLVAIAFGVVIGSNLDKFLPKRTLSPYAYVPRVPKSITGESEAFSDIVKAVSPTVVNISTTKTVRRDIPAPHFFDDPFFDNFFEPFRAPKKWKEQSLGSGVIVSGDGYIITNTHVIEKADEIKVILYDKQEYKGKVIGTDPKTDLAIIKIGAKDLPAIKWSNSDELQVGEFVLAFGNPYGLSHTVTMGIVSALGRANVGIAEYEDFIQTDAAINPGNSGGPLVTIRGGLVGINTAIFSRTGGYQGIGFAVPSNMAKRVMEQLVKTGKVTRGWLGVTIQQVTPDLAKQFNLNNSNGALVSDILKGGPAEKAGLKKGDVVIELNGKTIKDVESLRNMVSQSEVGSTVKLKVIREGKPIFIDAHIAELPKDSAEAMPERLGEKPTEENELAGFTVMGITPEIAKQLGLSKDEKGVVIISVESDSAAEESGLRKGDVIQEVNKKRISNLAEFNKITYHIKEGDTVLLFVNRGGQKFYVTLRIY